VRKKTYYGVRDGDSLGKAKRKLPGLMLRVYFFFFPLQYWSLNSRTCTSQVGVLPLEPGSPVFYDLVTF
jgi:hypothetical protein